MRSRSILMVSFGVLMLSALCVPAFGGEKEDASVKGAQLFADPSLGTNKKSCSSCHADGKVWAGKPRFPKTALGGVRTLDQAVQTCIVNALQGQPLAWDDKRLTALVIFIDGIYTPGGK